MTPETVMSMAFQATKITLALAAPILLTALIVGLVISIFQAATQINEMTLTFIPKILAIVVALVLSGPWLIGLMVDYIRQLFSSIPTLVG